MSLRRIQVGLLLLAGCGALDPWGELGDVPPSPSAAYLSRVAPPAPPPDFGGRGVTLEECVAVALERHPETRAAWLAARAAAARAGEEKAAFLPAAGFTAGVSRSDTPKLRDDGVSPQTVFDARFSVRYLLFAGGGRAARVQGARAELLALNFLHHAALQEVALGVELAYFERLAAESLARVAEETQKQAQTHLDLARARQQRGLAAKFDVLKAETQKADADLVLVRARSAARAAAGRLAHAMGLRVTESFEIAEIPEEAQKEERADIDALLAEAAANRPELREALARVEARQADLRAARAEYWPTVTTGGDYGWTNLDDKHSPLREDWSVGVGVDFPLFLGFAREYRMERARADLERAAAGQETALRGVELEVWTAYQRLREAQEAIAAARVLVASAEESARAAEGMYRVGTASIIELVDSLTSRTAARNRQVLARLDWRTAMARFERAVGRTLAGGDR